MMFKESYFFDDFKIIMRGFFFHLPRKEKGKITNISTRTSTYHPESHSHSVIQYLS